VKKPEISYKMEKKEQDVSGTPNCRLLLKNSKWALKTISKTSENVKIVKKTLW
jgi:hypothetical protein